MLSSRIAPKPGSLFLICFACIASSPFFLLILMKRSAKQVGKLSFRDCQHVYWQIVRELGKRPPERKVPDWSPEMCDSGFSIHNQRPLSCRLPGLTMASKATRGGFKEQRGGRGCVTVHRILICSEERGDPIRIFFIQPRRDRAFFRGPCCNTVH